MPAPQSAICLVIDRLSTAYVGALGNTWIHTPALDSLAAESIVFDRAMIDSPVIEETYCSYWKGMPAWLSAAPTGETLIELCRERGLTTSLVTDANEVAEHELAGAFDEIVRLPLAGEMHQARDWQETQFAHFFAAAIDVLRERDANGLIWLHTAALGRAWDSPQSEREQYGDEEDPSPPAMVEPPSFLLDGATEPDFLLGLRHAYAGEICVLDRCLAMFMETIEETSWRESLLCLTSPRGYPLGEHGAVGGAAEALYGELVRAALFVRPRNRIEFGARSDVLAQPADVFATVCQSLGVITRSEHAAGEIFKGRSLLGFEQERDTWRDLAAARSPSGETALTTAAWYLRAPTALRQPIEANSSSLPGSQLGESRIELFVKPDDYFEVNEISDRCGAIAGELGSIVATIGVAQSSSPSALSLSDALLHGTEASRS